MLLNQHIQRGIQAGTIDLVFRQWAKPLAKTGGRQRCGVGEIAIEDVTTITRAQLTLKDIRRAGYASKAELLAILDSLPPGQLYRIQVRYAGPDPRAALREDADLSPADIAGLEAKLAKLDAASAHGPWTYQVLHHIQRAPGTHSEVMATELGWERAWMKIQIRKLKELGLTISLRPGYRLAPRGEALLRTSGREGANRGADTHFSGKSRRTGPSPQAT